VRFLARHGLLEEAYTPEQATEVITRAARDPDWLWEHRLKARRLGKPDASKNLAQLVLREAN
jgi:UDP-N-acetylglucosamine:LPS N-acetylglucosamine transferase